MCERGKEVTEGQLKAYLQALPAMVSKVFGSVRDVEETFSSTPSRSGWPRWSLASNSYSARKEKVGSEESDTSPSSCWQTVRHSEMCSSAASRADV